LPDYINPNSYIVHLTGPDGVVIQVKPHAKMSLPDYFDRYRARGFIKLATAQTKQTTIVKGPQSQLKLNRTAIRKSRQRSTKEEQTQAQKRQFIQENAQAASADKRKIRRQEITKARKIARGNQTRKRTLVRQVGDGRLIVGKRLAIDATELLHSNLGKHHFPISNNIGVGIMSYERVDTLRRLVNSINKHTDLRKTTVFISDDGSQNKELLTYLDELASTHNFVVLKNKERLGIAGNSNRLIRCLFRFQYGMILNDDVEVLKNDWEYCYVDAMRKTGFHHFLYRQIGVYGASQGDAISREGITLYRVDDKPHGAIMAFSHKMLEKCGYFDEGYGFYGMEHVDWSQKAWEMELQEKGFFDVDGSNNYFKIHSDKSAVEGRDDLLREARKRHLERLSLRIGPTEASRVPEITYVVPFRNTERNDAIITVINNIRAQRFPVVHIVMVEQDSTTRIKVDDYAPVFYYLAQETENLLFNKALAFNIGVKNTTTSKVVLHDADMLTQGHYTQRVWDILEGTESCHLGGKVIYTDEDSAKKINTNNIVDFEVECERVVGYFEGGSLACTVAAYWKAGAFNEDYWGYGCFLPGNKVITNRGLVSIENVKKCDRLLTHTGEYRKQEARIRNYNGPVLDIFIPGRLPIKGVTLEHPFLTHDKNGEYVWKKAADLQKGDLIAQTDVLPDLSPTMRFQDVVETDKSKNRFNMSYFGSNSTGKTQFGLIYDIRSRQYNGPVYNFEVEKDHSYYVHGIAVHNCEDCDFYARLSGYTKWVEDRSFDFLHLWHGRVSGWNKHHSQNKDIESKLGILSIIVRVQNQYQQLKKNGYNSELDEAIK